MNNGHHGMAAWSPALNSLCAVLSFLTLLQTAHAERYPIGDPATSKSYLEINTESLREKKPAILVGVFADQRPSGTVITPITGKF